MPSPTTKRTNPTRSKKHSYDDDGDTGTAPDNSDFYYDDAGNLVLDEEKFYKYDAWNRIVAVHDKETLSVDAGGSLSGLPATEPFVTYDYDALGRRIAKTVLTPPSPTEYFYYDGHRVIEHHVDDGNDGTTLLKQYVYGLNYIDEPVAYYDADAVTGLPVTTPHFILRDANYDVVGITDDQGTLVQQMTLDPYGSFLYIEDGVGAAYNGGPAELSELLTPFGRNALWYDPETSLYYNRARYYDPVLGRWRQRDPNGTGSVCSCGLKQNGKPITAQASITPNGQYSDSQNLYSYVGNAPTSATDPQGLFKCEHAGGVGGWFAFAGYENDRYIYTCGCGWLDREHVRTWQQHSTTVWNDLQVARLKGAGLASVQFKQEMYFRGIEFGPTTGYLTLLEDGFAETAAAITFDLSVRLERRQGPLGFSAEDLPSNAVGRSMAMDGVLSFSEDEVRPWIEDRCGKILTAPQAKKVCNDCTLDSSAGKTKPISPAWDASRTLRYPPVTAVPAIASGSCNPFCSGAVSSAPFGPFLSIPRSSIQVMPGSNGRSRTLRPPGVP